MELPSETYPDQCLGASEVMYKSRREIRGKAGRRRIEKLLLLLSRFPKNNKTQHGRKITF